MSDGRRQRRVAETIKNYIAEALARELYDPRLAGLIVTQVEIGADLSLARVHVRLLVPTTDPAARLEVEKAANRAVPILRRGLGAQLGIKKTPTLEFTYDSSQDAIDRVEELLGEIQREGGSAPK
jgi:ribosome-binding factor A